MTLQVFLLLVPILTFGSALILYRFTGRRQFFKLDSIQFFYAFILAPVFFIWAKTLFFTLIRNELAIPLTQNEIFVLDTAFTTFLLYIFGFVVIHSLTKTFNLQTINDPLYDIFYHSEYFHLWITHLFMFGGLMTVLSVFAIANLFFPLNTGISQNTFYLISSSGILGGIIGFLGIWLSDPKQAKNFMRVMKLLFGLFFIVHSIFYFVLDPKFEASYGVYWWSSIAFATMVVISFFAHKSSKAQRIIEYISDMFKHKEWNFRLELFGKKE